MSAKNNLPESVTRRRMLTTSAGIVAGACAAGRVPTLLADEQAGDVPDLDKHPWIDAHSHIWSRDVAKYPLANGNTVDNLSPPSFTDEELLALAHASGVGRVVLIHHHPYHGWDNSYLVDTAARSPRTFRVVGTVDNREPKPGRRMRAMLAQHVTGFRITPRFNEGSGSTAAWTRCGRRPPTRVRTCPA
ncbi:MAG: hypothetical protein R3C10_27485 [Pirellulales bacterium]